MATNIFVDRASEVYPLLRDIVSGSFDRFDEVEPRAGSVYLIGRLEMSRCQQIIREAVEQQGCHVIFSNPAEGSESLLDQFDRLGIRDLVFDRKIAVLGGGDIEPGIDHLKHENFLFLTSIEPRNAHARKYTTEIFAHKDKPYRYLFLNGRLRCHRKWLIESFRYRGLLDHGLWSCLHANRGGRRHNLTFMLGGRNLMFEAESVRLLPPQYEFEQVHDRYSQAQISTWAKPMLFAQEWLDAVIQPSCYVDTYFSVVTETVFAYPYSFRTEKIWKPIMIGHPWICAANQGFYRDMKNLGFQTFGGLIDESFDSISNDQERLQRLSDSVYDLCHSNLASFLTAAEPICKYNQQHFNEMAPKIGAEFGSNFIQFCNQLYQS